MKWTALVPYKAGTQLKSRLGDSLSPVARRRLAEDMLAHLQTVLVASDKISRVVVIAPNRPAAWAGEWLLDPGGGLNAAVQAAELVFGRPVLAIHGDLPLVSVDDVEALLDAAEIHGAAIAPDRHQIGTNAVALADDRPFKFHFGGESRLEHRTEAEMDGRQFIEVFRRGLAVDCDTLDDLEFAQTEGWREGSVE